MEEKHLYLRAFFEAYHAQIVSAARLSPAHMRSDTIKQAHLYAREATDSLLNLFRGKDEVRREVQ